MQAEKYPRVISYTNFERAHKVVKEAHDTVISVREKYQSLLKDFGFQVQLEEVTVLHEDYTDAIGFPEQARVKISFLGSSVPEGYIKSYTSCPSLCWRLVYTDICEEVCKLFCDYLVALLSKKEQMILKMVKSVQLGLRDKDGGWVAAKDIRVDNSMKALAAIEKKGLFHIEENRFNGRRFRIPYKIIDSI